MNQIYSKLESYIRTVKAECKARKDIDEQHYCKLVLYRLKGIVKDMTGPTDIKNFIQTLSIYQDQSKTNSEFQFYSSVKARLKSILKEAK